MKRSATTLAGLCLAAASVFSCKTTTPAAPESRPAPKPAEEKVLVCKFRAPMLPIPDSNIYQAVHEGKLVFAFEDAASGEMLGASDNCLLVRVKGTESFAARCGHLEGDTVLTPVKKATHVTISSVEGTTDKITDFEITLEEGVTAEVKTNAPCELQNKSIAPTEPTILPKSITL